MADQQWMTGPVCADMLIQDVLLRFPQTLPVFKQYGLPCPRCLASGYENVGQLAVMLKVNLADLITDLNRAAAPAAPVATRFPSSGQPSRN